MLNNKKAWLIHELAGKHLDDYSKYAFPYEVCANVLESSKYGDEFVGISYLSKCFKGLPKNMWLSEYDFANYSTKEFSRLYPAYKFWICLILLSACR